MEPSFEVIPIQALMNALEYRGLRQKNRDSGFVKRIEIRGML